MAKQEKGVHFQNWQMKKRIISAVEKKITKIYVKRRNVVNVSLGLET